MIIGLDVSLRSTGIAWLKGLTPTVWTVKSKPPQTVNEVAKLILSHLTPILDNESVVYIEDYAFGKFGKSNSLTSLIELTGILQYELYNMQIQYHKVAPTAVKKFLSGKGVLSKDQIPLLIYKKFDLTLDTVDACDALAIADYGYALTYGTGFNRELNTTEKKMLIKKDLTFHKKYAIL